MARRLEIYAVEDLGKASHAACENRFFEDAAAIEAAARAHVVATGEVFTVYTEADPELCAGVAEYARICNITRISPPSSVAPTSAEGGG